MSDPGVLPIERKMNVTGKRNLGCLIHIGSNMWCDRLPEQWGGKTDLESRQSVRAADYVRLDEDVYRAYVRGLARAGCSFVVLDLGEAVVYPSHPELAVKGSWTPERLRQEIAALRALGLEAFPKLNFSAGHDIWLKEYSRMLSTPTYYRVCADLIRDVVDLFDRPRLFHLGYDEEDAANQSQYEYCVIRQGELWWHDFLKLEREVERAGSRPWIWSDYGWLHWDEMERRMPKSVLQSNWYYNNIFDLKDPKLSKYHARGLALFEKLEKAGFDQMPCGSNYRYRENFAALIRHCDGIVSPDRNKGYLLAPWGRTTANMRSRQDEAVAVIAEVNRGASGNTL